MENNLQIYNSLTREKQEFKPQDPKRVSMYTCGPTVYGPSHVGHARTYTNFDLLKRVLQYNGYHIEHVLNFTDVHDSMIEEAQKRQVSVKELGEEYIKHFHLDLTRLNIRPADIYPRVTEHIDEILNMIKILVEKGFAYESGGSVYYDVSKFKNYGKLSGRKLEEAKTGTRVAADKYEREEVSDFALWKKAEEGDEEVGAVWNSPWGKGRPGWHIECSVMSKVHLGETLDIHGGGMDLKFPHHENEIAQSEAATGKKFVNYWIHGGTLSVEGKKMAKSLGNFINFDEIVQKEFDPLSFRYLCLTAHYRGELNFTWAGLTAAQTALNNLYNEIAFWDKPASAGCAEFENKFTDLINDDLNIPDALALMWKVVKDKELPSSCKMNTILKMDEIFGLKLGDVEKLFEEEIPEEVQKLVEDRELQRRQGNWVEADDIRKDIEERGWRVEDSEGGTVVRRVRDIL